MLTSCNNVDVTRPCDTVDSAPEAGILFSAGLLSYFPGVKFYLALCDGGRAAQSPDTEAPLRCLLHLFV